MAESTWKRNTRRAGAAGVTAARSRWNSELTHGVYRSPCSSPSGPIRDLGGSGHPPAVLRACIAAPQPMASEWKEEEEQERAQDHPGASAKNPCAGGATDHN